MQVRARARRPRRQRPGPARLDPYLERRRYAQGEAIMAQGTSGSECYLITEGEVRLEVERPDFDSDGVIAFLGPGMLLGEFSLLDGRPRSASAYAHTEVTALTLSEPPWAGCAATTRRPGWRC